MITAEAGQDINVGLIYLVTVVVEHLQLQVCPHWYAEHRTAGDAIARYQLAATK